MRLRKPLVIALLVITPWVGFVAFKAAGVARELVDPPFYKPPPLARVEATYADLAKGGQGDPGGTWSHVEVSGLQLWTLTRPRPVRGHVLLLHGFGDDRWGTSPALRWFPDLDASIFTYRRRDDVLRRGGQTPVTFGALERQEVAAAVRALEARGIPRRKLILAGRSLGASVALLALADLEREGGPLGGVVWEGAPASSRDFGQRLVRGARDRWWHAWIARPAGTLGSWLAARRGGYRIVDTEVATTLTGRRLATPSLTFIATQDRLAPLELQRFAASRFNRSQVVEVPTWHIHCAEVLGPRYGETIRQAYSTWLPEHREP